MIRRLSGLKLAGVILTGFVFLSCDFNFYQTETTTFDGVVRITYDRREKSYPAWSPDGNSIAYSIRDEEYVLMSYNYLTNDTLEEGRYELFPETYDFSPDGAKVLFNRYQKNGSIYYHNRDLYEMRLIDGAIDTLISDFQGSIYAPVWSQDGQQIAFVANNSIWIAENDGNGATEVFAAPRSIASLSWAPDRKHIAFQQSIYYRTVSSQSQIFVLDVETGEAQQITEDSLARSVLPDWSPDGSKIAYQLGKFDTTEIRIMNSDGTEQKRITEGIRRAYNPKWSPDGSKLACQDGTYNYSYNLRIYEKNGNFLYTIDSFSSTRWYDEESFLFMQENDYSVIETFSLIDSSITQVIPQQDFAEVTHPAWFENGQKLAYIYKKNNNSTIRSINLNSGVEQILFAGYATDFDISPDGNWLVFEHNQGNLFLKSLLSGEITDLRGYIGYGLFSPASNPWSNGGVCVSFNTFEYEPGLHIIKSDSSLNIERSFIEGNYYNPAWSSESPELGSHIAAESGGTIRILKPDGTLIGTTVYGGRQPSWSPDAKKIVYLGYYDDLYIKTVFADAPK